MLSIPFRVRSSVGRMHNRFRVAHLILRRLLLRIPFCFCKGPAAARDNNKKKRKGLPLFDE